MKTKNTFAAAVLLCACASACPLFAAEGQWMLGPLTRPAQVNPIIRPDAKLVFDCPMNNGQAVQWAALHTFNPAAAIGPDGRVRVLFRAEDASGAKVIGGHTSRIGLAESDDGVRFVSRPAPVLFPAGDNQRGNEWRGGCEDPRVVLTENGTYVMTYTQYYNGKNADKKGRGDPSLRGGVYCGGQALFDANDPAKLLQRPDAPFYKPEEAFERTGQYGAGTTFLEGLIYYKGKWFLYYGCADSFVAVAEADAAKPYVAERTMRRHP